MTTTVTATFAKLYSAEVHEAYQRHGSKLRNAVGIQTVHGTADVTWQKIGTVTASTKGRNSLVPTMDVSHTPITTTLQDCISASLSQASTLIDSAGGVMLQLLCTNGSGRGTPAKLKAVS